MPYVKHTVPFRRRQPHTARSITEVLDSPSLNSRLATGSLRSIRSTWRLMLAVLIQVRMTRDVSAAMSKTRLASAPSKVSGCSGRAVQRLGDSVPANWKY